MNQGKAIYLISLLMNEQETGLWKGKRNQSRNWRIIFYLCKKAHIDQHLQRLIVNGYVRIQNKSSLA